MWVNIGRICQVEELAIAALEDTEVIIAATEPEAIRALRRESRQLLHVIRWSSFYMLLLCFVYLVQAILCLRWLDVRDFEANISSKPYAREVYAYSV